MKPSLIRKTITVCACAAFACALAPSLAAQTTVAVTGQPNPEFRMLISSTRTFSPTKSATSAKLNTARAVFSDTEKPRTLRITDAFGHVEIQGVAGEGGEVTVSSPLALKKANETEDEGSRRLHSGADFELVEKDNVISLNISQFSGTVFWYSTDFKIQVPRDTNIIIENYSMAGSRNIVTIADTTGEVDIKLAVGQVTLKNTTGTITADAQLGRIAAELDKAPQKPVTLATDAGSVDLALPANAAANVGMTTSSGSVRTNFPEDALKITSVHGYTAEERLAAIRAKIDSRQREREARGGNAPTKASATAATDAIGAESTRLRQSDGATLPSAVRQALRSEPPAPFASASASASSNRDLTPEEEQRIQTIREKIAERRQTRESGAVTTAPTSSDGNVLSQEQIKKLSETIREEIARQRQARESGATTTAPASVLSFLEGKTITGEINGGGTDIRLISRGGVITLKQAQ